MQVSIDVIIPSFRLEEKYILPILRLPRPADAAVKFYLIVDNPSIQPSAAIRELVDHTHIFLLVNEQNMGAAETRNKGIDVTDADWILFLDDDIAVSDDLLVVYAQAAIREPAATGFIGLVQLPPPQSLFTKAIGISGSMDIFGIAEHKSSFAWGATANMMIRRSAIGDTRFSTAYPKSGGGEDVDFFLRVRERNGFENYRTLPQARVVHPWWNNEKVSFLRPFRYGKGNSWLGALNPQYTYYDFLNTPETVLLSLLAALLLFLAGSAWAWPVLIFTAGVLAIELVASAVQTVKRGATAHPVIIGYVTALRLVYETGVLWGKLSRMQPGKIGERFHDDGIVNKVFFYRSNTYRIVKWVLYPLLAWLILHHTSA
ncbi:glycosyltransferase family 2 protein [Chitinophaga japonensis]|uniref:GT2 family glycosyltransferase n=1 Tax=Chitinophaga japonensis TaxID=104662 RepID=A0A562SNI5_CHIJA|nr:glycosyltransferase [Chitinophaga japonensis]TWI82514.1 GT2 family glycosyltransferase [Chitinophaga japonensis]